MSSIIDSYQPSWVLLNEHSINGQVSKHLNNCNVPGATQLVPVTDGCDIGNVESVVDPTKHDLYTIIVSIFTVTVVEGME